MKIESLVFLVILLPCTLSAEVTRIQIDQRLPFAKGREFGLAGAYESISGRLFFQVDPNDPVNGRITDLKLAPLNKQKRVEFWADFCLLQPTDPSKGNGCLLYDVHNRGNKLALWTFNDGEMTNSPISNEHAGNGFLFNRGFSILWTGWNGDVQADGTNRLLAGLPIAKLKSGQPITGANYVEISVDERQMSQPFFGSPWGTPKAYPAISLNNRHAQLTMRPNRTQPATAVPRAEWKFAEYQQGEVKPHASSLYVKQGLRPGWLYELVYTARDPRVSGLGLAGLRDAISFFRYEKHQNPAGGYINRACIFGISQSGRVIHHFLYEGLNVDAKRRQLFDAALIHVAGAGKGLFNYRFAMATVYGTQRRGNLSPADFFPFTPMPQSDPVTGQHGDSLSRLRQADGIPKIFFVQTATEYWSRAASLLHTDVEGKRDLKIDPHVRIYAIAGAQHLGGGTTSKGICRYPRNPLKHRGPVLRALLVALDNWVTQNTKPPASRYPRIDDGTLVDVETFRAQFPKIPHIALPKTSYQPLRLNPGSRWHTQGIAEHVPPQAGKPFRTLVPAVDADGNEKAGIRLPDVAVPTATYMGWNLRDQKFGAAGELAGLHGSWLAFPHAPNTNDPRAAMLTRYPNRKNYLTRYTDSVLSLWKQRFLLEADAIQMLQRAASRNLWQQ